MNNMYKPNIIPAFFLVLFTCIVIACEENNSKEHEEAIHNNSSVNFPYAPDPTAPDSKNTSERIGDTALDTATRR